MLEVNNIAKEYTIGTEKIRALDGVSFNVNEGEIVGLIGRSGGGKRILIKMFF
jgi:ABC-type glutathione transport system ATPase component